MVHGGPRLGVWCTIGCRDLCTVTVDVFVYLSQIHQNWQNMLHNGHGLMCAFGATSVRRVNRLFGHVRALSLSESRRRGKFERNCDHLRQTATQTM